MFWFAVTTSKLYAIYTKSDKSLWYFNVSRNRDGTNDQHQPPHFSWDEITKERNMFNKWGLLLLLVRGCLYFMPELMPELCFIESDKIVDIDRAMKIIARLILQYLDKENNAEKDTAE